MTATTESRCRPILKWAGGKTQLLPQIRRFYPDGFRAYREPFVGSAAVFLDLYAGGRLDGHPVQLTDGNVDLIGCYQAVRDAVEDVIDHLEVLADGHRRGGSTHYYEVRNERFNPLRRQRLRTQGDLGGAIAYSPPLAAMLIYLNKTGYNGLFRLNASGGFNVPAGRYRNPRIVDAGNLRRVSAAFNMPDLTLAWRPFTDAGRAAEPGDFMYLDPPYAPLSRTARFTAYTAGGFSHADQVALQAMVVRLAARGCQLLMSNSTAPEIGDLYDGPGPRAAGLTAHRVPARRAINSRSTGRRPVEEYLITNIAARSATPIVGA